YRGQRGAVLWCDPYYARREPDRPGRWLYVVHLTQADCCRTFFESDLESAGRSDPALAHLGTRPEISLDTMLEAENAFIEGCYRLPGRFWEVMIFTRADVPELCQRPSQWESGITGTIFYVPRDFKLDWNALVQALSEAFGYEGWVQVK